MNCFSWQLQLMAWNVVFRLYRDLSVVREVCSQQVMLMMMLRRLMLTVSKLSAFHRGITAQCVLLSAAVDGVTVLIVVLMLMIWKATRRHKEIEVVMWDGELWTAWRTLRMSLFVWFVIIFYMFDSYGYLATATHFGLLTIWETGLLSLRHQCKHDVSILNCGFLDNCCPLLHVLCFDSVTVNVAWSERQTSIHCRMSQYCITLNMYMWLSLVTEQQLMICACSAISSFSSTCSVGVSHYLC